MPEPTCPHCDDTLGRLPGPNEGVAFFECPACRRQYAQKPGRSMTERWLAPISIVTYGLIFERDPMRRVAESARDLLTNSAESVPATVDAIRAELDHPTQRVSDIHDFAHGLSEEDLRAFLRALADQLERDRGRGP